MPAINKTTKLKQKEWRGKIADQRTKDRSQYPAAPSAGPGILKIYRQLLKQAVNRKKHFSACVLGATPELRDMVLKQGGDLTSIDVSLDMIQKTSPLMKHTKRGKENILISDWLNSPLADNYFDVVLGDGVSNNIAYQDQIKFFKEIKRLLKPNGHLIIREGVINPQRPISSVEDINTRFMTGQDHWFDTFMDLRFYCDLSKRCANPAQHKWFMHRLFNELAKAHQIKRLNKKTIDTLWWFRSDLTHTVMPHARLEQLMTKQFDLKPTPQAQDYNFTADTFLFFTARPKS